MARYFYCRILLLSDINIAGYWCSRILVLADIGIGKCSSSADWEIARSVSFPQNYCYWQLLVLQDITIGGYWYWRILVLADIGIGGYYHWRILVLADIGIGKLFLIPQADWEIARSISFPQNSCSPSVGIVRCRYYRILLFPDIGIGGYWYWQVVPHPSSRLGDCPLCILPSKLVFTQCFASWAIAPRAKMRFKWAGGVPGRPPSDS